MPKKRDETFADFLVRMAGLLCEVIEEIEENGDLDVAGLLRLALWILSASANLRTPGRGSSC